MREDEVNVQLRSLVVCGHARGVGKTALVADIIRAFPERDWVGVKVSPHGHGAWSDGAGAPDPKALSPDVLLEEETKKRGQSGNSRVLSAGARLSYWLRTQEGCLREGLRKLEPNLQATDFVVFESNAVLKFLEEQLCLMALDPRISEFKPSATNVLDRVDAFVSRGPLIAGSWEGVALDRIRSRPVFEQILGAPLPEGLRLLIRNKLFSLVHPATTPRHLPG